MRGLLEERFRMGYKCWGSLEKTNHTYPKMYGKFSDFFIPIFPVVYEHECPCLERNLANRKGKN